MPQLIEKYHGLGNDFILVDASTWTESHALEADWLERVQRLCDRHRGVGADGVILCRPEQDGAVRMIIFNQDGSRPEMCGNGVRCAVLWSAARGLLDEHGEIVIRSDAGDRACRVVAQEASVSQTWQVAVGMGAARMPVAMREVSLAGHGLKIWDVDMGNPHAVSLVGVPELTAIDAMGAEANSARTDFPQGVNVEFVERIGPQRYRTVVYERGVGRTQACGTGACAVAAALWAQGEVSDGDPVEVHLPGGPLTIERRGGEEVWMKGPAVQVFKATINEPLWYTAR